MEKMAEDGAPPPTRLRDVRDAVIGLRPHQLDPAVLDGLSCSDRKEVLLAHEQTNQLYCRLLSDVLRDPPDADAAPNHTVVAAAATRAERLWDAARRTSDGWVSVSHRVYDMCDLMREGGVATKMDAIAVFRVVANLWETHGTTRRIGRSVGAVADDDVPNVPVPVLYVPDEPSAVFMATAIHKHATASGLWPGAVTKDTTDDTDLDHHCVPAGGLSHSQTGGREWGMHPPLSTRAKSMAAEVERRVGRVPARCDGSPTDG